MPEPIMSMGKKEPTEEERVISEWMSKNDVSFGEKFFVYWVDQISELTIYEDFSNQRDSLKFDTRGGKASMDVKRAIEGTTFRKATQEEVSEAHLDIENILTKEIEDRITRREEVRQIISSCEKEETQK